MSIELITAVSGALSPQSAAAHALSAETRAAGAASGADGASFSQFLTEAAESGRRALGEAETASLRGLSGDAPLHVVVGKVMEAERALQTAIALRDRFVASLQDISRMQI
ncbi:MAG: flagellar hook-basal body complex protein FliE [Rhizobiales bacterium]|nr:flagellar hook-basal body complex protein FliE [Hyphomicrobiales bacterium]